MAETADRLRDAGWALLPALHTQDDLRSFAAMLDELRARFGATVLHRDEPAWLAEGVEVARPGLAFYRLLELAPELGPRLFPAALLAAVRDVLGEEPRIEMVGAVTSDETRPFTEWETHLGGPRDAEWRREGRRPRKARIERVAAFVFLEELGPWRVLPRRVGDPVEPPRAIDEPDWPDAVTLNGPPGSVLILDESTWHCVPPRATPGLRRFVGAYFARADAE